MQTNTITRGIIRLAVTTSIACTALIGGAGIAAADEWPPVPTQPSPTAPYETKNFLTPTDPAYWNPLDTRNRLTSPYGTSTRIVCTAFHGVTLGCWQADRDGNPHKLIALPFNFPAITGSAQPGGGASHYVYPGLF
ncbi:hypothetical protein AB0B25_03875 [Nocardia sp. NPDC049190]|uniref:hypothetical protein n=1 Tax=Nocardia sp. NPDC049190 TaxID=3155650 RepID=UPI00340B17F3